VRVCACEAQSRLRDGAQVALVELAPAYSMAMELHREVRVVSVRPGPHKQSLARVLAHACLAH
jgi:hypothetical protein